MKKSEEAIYAVTVNHNTSHFAELMLRSLFYTDALAMNNVHMTVLDNASSDKYLGSLQDFLGEKNCAFSQTGFDDILAPEKHGAALEHFVIAQKHCRYFLFLDSDIWFVEPKTVETMLEELRQAPDTIFAVQAQIYGYYAHKIIEGSNIDSSSWRLSFENTQYETTSAKRCSPVCCLVKNSNTFRKVVEGVGLGRAIRFEVSKAKYFDTFALMTETMARHGFEFMVSRKKVNHFTMTSYDDEGRNIKDKNCLTMLQELRKERGMTHTLFHKSDWLES